MAPTPHAGNIFPVTWVAGRVRLIDQTRLPAVYETVEIGTVADMARAIKTMIVRGAPAIGVAAAYGMVLALQDCLTAPIQTQYKALEEAADLLKASRPTAVNLFWAVDQMLVAAGRVGDASLHDHLLHTAHEIAHADLETCQAIGAHGLSVLPESPQQLRLLTHCNAGALATAGYGTALGVVRAAWAAGRLARVYADETRPRLQGAKLTTWECVQESIPVTLITDNMAAHCMAQGLIDLVVVGADRIAANGDTANKIGTYGLALVAQAHGIPFYVAAPRSTLDFTTPTGAGIPIEERDANEVLHIGPTPIAPPSVEVYNPAFDVTPAGLITGIITECGVYAPSHLSTLKPSP
ncbi:MAG: S-methyl-5-thioribose-1-phosphate isomerase [Gloeomargaritaceae cyanobacterium C42_A2020_066]|nr:S-methyl-5-thioribose-1-phosphate isomerase [Gloeomargaritaceae cyanobacterium C42_A2020_066]